MIDHKLSPKLSKQLIVRDPLSTPYDTCKPVMVSYRASMLYSMLILPYRLGDRFCASCPVLDFVRLCLVRVRLFGLSDCEFALCELSGYRFKVICMAEPVPISMSTIVTVQVYYVVNVLRYITPLFRCWWNWKLPLCFLYFFK